MASSEARWSPGMMGPRGGRSSLWLGAALVAVLLVVPLLGSTPGSAAAGSVSSLPPASSSSPGSSARASAAPLPSGFAEPPADLFTRAPDPLDLTPVPADEAAASKVIGPKGGTLKATGPDGTRFRLMVPKGDLPMATTITMTPLADLTGFPSEATPDHTIGVQLEPDGLELALPAVLTIRPKDGFPEVGVVAMDYRGTGEEAGFHTFDQGRSQVTIEVEHFSGYSADFELTVNQIRRIAEGLRTDPAEVLASEMAEMIQIERQKQLLEGGDESNLPLHDLALYYLPLFKQVVLAPLVAAAGRGCRDAEAAMRAVLSYQSQRQKLGVGSDPAFDLQAGTMVPARLADLATRLCFREDFDECVQTGDFPWLLNKFYAAFRQFQNLLGIEPTDEQVQLAHGYLRRCGRYELKATAQQQGKADFVAHLDIQLEWKPAADASSNGGWGIVGSTIEGSAEQTISGLPIRAGVCAGGQDKRRVLSLGTVDRATASIEGLAFDHIRGRTLQGRTLIPANPRSLRLLVGFGTMQGRSNCGEGNEMLAPYLLFPWVGEAMRGGGAKLTRASADSFRFLALDGAGWRFSGSPFTATKQYSARAVAGDLTADPVDADVELVLIHTPG